MAGEFEMDMDKHFAMAGIPADNNEQSGADNGGSSSQSEQQPSQGQQQNQEPTGTEQVGQNIEQRIAREGQQSGGNNGTQQQGQKKEGQTPGNSGDITLSDGSVVKGGAERRWYQEAQQNKTLAVNRAAELNTANQRYQNLEARYNELKNASAQIGLESPQLVSNAVRLYKDLTSNPVQTVTNLLAELKAKGHSFEGIGGAVDTEALRRLIQTNNGNSNNKNSQDDEQQRIIQEATETRNAFLANNPDAAIHEPFIVALLDKDPGKPLLEVYAEFKAAALANGYDWSKPLGPQIQARIQQQSGQTQQTQQTQQQQRQPGMISGNGSVGGQAMTERNPNQITQADSIEDAILAGMRESGLQYSRG